MNDKIFTYWEGPRSPLIEICLESLERWNSGKVVVLGPEDIPGSILEETDGISLPYRSDLVRLWALLDQGGIWVDSDSIATRPLSLLEMVPDLDLFGTYNQFTKRGWGASGITATPIGGRAGNPILQEMFDHCLQDIRKIKKGGRVSYGMTSVGVASWAYKRHQEKGSVRRFNHWKFNPIPWWSAREIFLRQAQPMDHELGGAWRPLAELYHLTNPITHHFREAPRSQLETGRSFTAFLVQKALSIPPGIFGRTSEILKRIPLGKEVRGAEIGVLQALNARHLLHQRPDLTLHLVDPWAPQDPSGSYRASGDYQSRWTEVKWDEIHRRALNHVLPYRDRVNILRGLSHEMATQVEDGSLDFVFIDGDHSLEGVQKDLETWFPKLREGGFLCGHDYGSGKKTYGVDQAVEAFANKHQKRVETGLDLFWAIR